MSACILIHTQTSAQTNSYNIIYLYIYSVYNTYDSQSGNELVAFEKHSSSSIIFTYYFDYAFTECMRSVSCCYSRYLLNSKDNHIRVTAKSIVCAPDCTKLVYTYILYICVYCVQYSDGGIFARITGF